MFELHFDSEKDRTVRLLIRKIVSRVCNRESQATRLGAATYISLFERDPEGWTDEECVLLLALSRHQKDTAKETPDWARKPEGIHLNMASPVLNLEAHRICREIIQTNRKSDTKSQQVAFDRAVAKWEEMSAPDSGYVVSPTLDSDSINVWEKALNVSKFASSNCDQRALNFITKTLTADDLKTELPVSSTATPEARSRPMSKDTIRRRATEEIQKKRSNSDEPFSSRSSLAKAIGCSRNAKAFKEIWDSLKALELVVETKQIEATAWHDNIPDPIAHDPAENAIYEEETRREKELERLTKEQESDDKQQHYSNRSKP